jgi:hypothetical protein
MARVTRLVTVVEVDDRTFPAQVLDVPRAEGSTSSRAQPAVAPISSGAPADGLRQMSLSALHLAVLDDGCRVTLLDDRGWCVQGPPDVWRRSIDDLRAEARTVVGPDEPYGGHSQPDMEADHWAHLTAILRQHGVRIDAEEIRRVPHDVELSERLLARITTT